MNSSSVVGATEEHKSQRAALVAGGVVLLVIAVVGLAWAKWIPYSHKVGDLSISRSWSGTALTDAARSAPTWWQGAGDFTVAYTLAVWKALIVGLLIAAAVDALLPKRWLRDVLTRRSRWGGPVVAGVASLPSMMCTCCTAPVAVSLRRSGVPASAAVAYWLGNPVLNPADLVFLALVGPWQWVAVRLAVGAMLVVGAGVLVAGWVAAERSRGRGSTPPVVTAGPVGLEEDVQLDHQPGATAAVRRYVISVARLTVTLLPEYAVVVFAVGAAAHVLPSDAGWLSRGVLGLIVLAVVATLMVIPTGGEIPSCRRAGRRRRPATGPSAWCCWRCRLSACPRCSWSGEP